MFPACTLRKQGGYQASCTIVKVVIKKTLSTIITNADTRTMRAIRHENATTLNKSDRGDRYDKEGENFTNAAQTELATLPSLIYDNSSFLHASSTVEYFCIKNAESSTANRMH